jgi:predicted DNA binding CopG/RHH family protein
MKSNEYKFDAYEQDLLDLFESGQLNRISDFEEEKRKLLAASKKTSSKMMQISIEIPENELTTLKQKSSEYGISFDSVIRLLIHSYNSGILHV